MKKFYSNKYQAKFAKRVKKVIMKTAEPKSFSTAISKVELYHNTLSVGLFQMNASTRMPAAGTSDNQRVGDQINVSGFKLRLLIGQKADRPNCTFRYWVVKVPKGSTYVYNQWFNNTTANILLDDINKDFVKVLKTGIWKPYKGATTNGTDEFTFTRKLWIPYKKIVKFGPANGAVTHNDEDIWMLIAPYDAYGTITATENIAYMEGSQEIFYRDP